MVPAERRFDPTIEPHSVLSQAASFAHFLLSSIPSSRPPSRPSAAETMPSLRSTPPRGTYDPSPSISVRRKPSIGSEQSPMLLFTPARRLRRSTILSSTASKKFGVVILSCQPSKGEILLTLLHVYKYLPITDTRLIQRNSFRGESHHQQHHIRHPSGQPPFQLLLQTPHPRLRAPLQETDQEATRPNRYRIRVVRRARLGVP